MDHGLDEWISPYVRGWGDKLAHFAFTYVLDPDDAQDVVQEAFLRLLRWGRDHHQEPASLPWMYTVTRNLALDHLRMKRRELSVRVAEWSVHAPDLEVQVAVRATIDRMPPRDREVLWLFYYEDWPAADIAREMNMTPNAVRLRLVRARQRFERLWEGDASGERS
jgi:RNA polymerase sigma factor (sigma-70 family)